MMNIHKSFDTETYNFPPELQPLFDALLSGTPVKQIRCMKGHANAGDKAADFTLVDTDYWVALAQNFNGSEKYDYVDIIPQGQKDAFYMSWVRSFTLNKSSYFIS